MLPEKSLVLIVKILTLKYPIQVSFSSGLVCVAFTQGFFLLANALPANSLYYL